MSLARIVAVMAAAFCLTLAVIVVHKLSSEALAVAIGVVCGVGAGIPASVLLYLALARRTRRADELDEAENPLPPVIVVQGQPPASHQEQWLAPPGKMPSRTHVRLVGGDDLWPDPGEHDNGG